MSLGKTNINLTEIKSNPYEQIVNYTMLYDGGDECTDITGGWSPYTDSNWGAGTTTKNADNLYMYSSGTNSRSIFRTNNRLDTSAYKKSFTVGKYSISTSGSSNKIKMSWEKTGSVTVGETNITSVATDKNIVLEVAFNEVYTDLQCLLVTYSHDTRNTTKFNVYHTGMVKSDDWETLCSKAGITPSSIDGVLTQSEAILSNKNAVQFMVSQCTGEFMVSAIQNSTFMTALNSSPYKTIVQGNEHWSKFLAMVA